MAVQAELYAATLAVGADRTADWGRVPVQCRRVSLCVARKVARAAPAADGRDRRGRFGPTTGRRVCMLLNYSSAAQCKRVGNVIAMFFNLKESAPMETSLCKLKRCKTSSLLRVEAPTNGSNSRPMRSSAPSASNLSLDPPRRRALERVAERRRVRSPLASRPLLH